MRGNERRYQGAGRRSSDEGGGALARWIRVVVLTLALAVAVYVLLIARQTARPQREAEALRVETLVDDARLMAARIEGRLTTSDAALRLAQTVLARNPGRPLDAIEAARAAAPQTAFALVGPTGAVLAVGGAHAETFAVPTTADAGAGTSHARLSAVLSADGAALILHRTIGGSRFVARVPLVSLQDAGGDAASLAVATPTGFVSLSGSALPAIDFDVLKAADKPLSSRAGDKGVLISAVAPIGDTGLLAVASKVSPRATGVLGDAWVLLAPLSLGALVIVLLMLQNRRQKRTGRQWEETEHRFRVAVEAARCGVWEWDLQNETVVVSEYMTTLLGLPKSGEVEAADVFACVHPKYREIVEHALRQAAIFGAFETTFPVSGPNNTVRWIDARGQARGGRVDGDYTSILGVALDITEARRAKAHVQAAESRLRDGIESVSDAFSLFDRHGRLILCNQAFTDTFGLTPEAVRRGAHKDELNRIAALAIKREHLASQAQAGVHEVELHDGRWLQISERFTSDGGTVVTATDLTTIKRQEAESKRAADALRLTVDQLETSQEKLSQLARKYEVAMIRAEAASQAKSGFLANMSHELRTPLNAINGFSEIMAGEMFGPVGDPRYKGYAADILKSGQHLLSLINDILDMAKIEAGKLTLHYEKVSLKEVCEDALRLMRGKAEDSGLTLMLDAPDLPEIDADQRGMKQVLLNLISNAVKFTPEGGVITVSVRGEVRGRQRVSVVDTGIGIAAEDLARLARPFEQVEGQHSRTTQGTGLGLALTKALIEMHHGAMSMTSEPGTGTVVSFEVPVTKPAEVDSNQARAA